MTFAELLGFAEAGATIGDCGQIELRGAFVGYPEDHINPEHRGCRDVLELDEDGAPTGRWVSLPYS